MQKHELPKESEIQTPQDLTEIIRTIQFLLEKGVLIESTYWPKDRLRPCLPSFKEIVVTGPWPDYMEYYFQEPFTGCYFQFVCETYHGLGGKWEIYNHQD